MVLSWQQDQHTSKARCKSWGARTGAPHSGVSGQQRAGVAGQHLAGVAGKHRAASSWQSSSTSVSSSLALASLSTGCGKKPSVLQAPSHSSFTEYMSFGNDRDLLLAVPIAFGRGVGGAGAAWMKVFRTQRPMRPSFASTDGDSADAGTFSGFICVIAQSGSASHPREPSHASLSSKSNSRGSPTQKVWLGCATSKATGSMGTTS